MKTVFTKYTNTTDIFLPDPYGSDKIGIGSLFRLYLKTIYSTNIGKAVIILSPMFVAFGLNVMFPIYISVGAAQVFVTSLSAGIIWGMTYFSIRRTTFYSNLHTTSISKIKVYLAIWFAMLFVTFWSESSFWIVTMLMDVCHVRSFIDILLNFVSSSEHSPLYAKSYDVIWYKVDWITLVYTWIASVTMMFVACFATRWIFNTEQTYFAILLIYILVLIPFGGILPPMPGNFNANDGYVTLNKDINFVSVISMAMPQYHFNLFNYISVWTGVDIAGIQDGPLESLGHMDWLVSFKWSTSWKWDFTILYPFICGFIFLILDILSLFLINIEYN